MSANPIGLIILAILILIGIIILIIKNWDTLKAVVLDVWASILGAIRTAWDWLKANVFDRLIAMVQLNVQIWRELWAAVKSTWDNIMNALANNAVTQAIQKVIDKVRELIDWFKSAKLPDWVTNLNPFANSAGSSRVFALAAGESAAGRGRVGAGSLLTETVSLAARLSAPAVVVNVILDGKRVGGYVDRVVTARLDDEGARLAAGAWG
jgi:hypothetical protein